MCTRNTHLAIRLAGSDNPHNNSSLLAVKTNSAASLSYDCPLRHHKGLIPELPALAHNFRMFEEPKKSEIQTIVISKESTDVINAEFIV